MQLWLILSIVVIAVAIFKVSRIKSGGGYDYVTPIIAMGSLGLALMICLVLYIVHLKGCLNQKIGVTMSVEQADILPVKENE